MPFFPDKRQLFFVGFVFLAAVISVVSLLYSNKLARNLAVEERTKIEIWASAIEQLATADENADMALILKVLESNKTIPIILYDENTDAFTTNNIKLPDSEAETRKYLPEKAEHFSEKHEPIVLPELNQTIYYDDSYTLKQLQIFPYFQLLVIAVFFTLAFFALKSSYRSEQNKVWVGLSKETAHQLGTPISSLVAWVEYLKLRGIDSETIGEIEKDITRLETITDRFSKIGSKSHLEQVIWQEAVRKPVLYLQKRISNQVVLNFVFPEKPLRVNLNASLFGWVVENLTKNAVDAMSGQGTITYTMGEKGKYCFLDISDTGKGISKSNFKTVFSPGFTTKERGWGLGLSLAKRIVENYHNGKIFVKKSEVGVGTVFRILLLRNR